MTPPSVARWPAAHRPEGAAVYGYNALSIAAPAERVWAWLIRAAAWPTYYANAWNIRFENAPGPNLALGTRFTWTTFYVRVDTTVVEFEPSSRLAWEGRTPGGVGYHAWVIEPTPSGCHVVTEETQRGIVPSLGRRLLRPGLLWQHQRWLEGLARRAVAGLPD